MNAIQALSQLSYTPVFVSSLALGCCPLAWDECYNTRRGPLCQHFFGIFSKKVSAALGQVIHGLFQGPGGAAQGAADFLFLALQAHTDGDPRRHAQGNAGAEGMGAAHRAFLLFVVLSVADVLSVPRLAEKSVAKIYGIRYNEVLSSDLFLEYPEAFHDHTLSHSSRRGGGQSLPPHPRPI